MNNMDISKQLQQLKAENESYEYQLEKRIEICDIWWGIANKYKQCLDEIEKLEKAYCKECLEKGNKSELYCVKCINRSILDTIKQAKEGGE